MFHLDHLYQKLITFIDHAENLDIFMSMYNLLKYCDNYSMTLGSFRDYDANENDNNSINNIKTKQVNYLIIRQDIWKHAKQ